MLNRLVLLLLVFDFTTSKLHRLRAFRGKHGGRASQGTMKSGKKKRYRKHGDQSCQNETSKEEPAAEDRDCSIVSSAADLQALLQPGAKLSITEVSLCPDTEIKFDQTVKLPPIMALNCPPNSPTVFDGQNQRRLFEYEVDTTLPQDEQWASMNFDNIIFQNGNEERGGAIMLKGDQGEPPASRAMFRNCTFQYNNGTYSYNGGAIDVEWWYSLVILNTTFLHNTAYTGGAIHALNSHVYVADSTFSGNTVCGAGEGPAIFVSSSQYPVAEYVKVECKAGTNKFEDNLDGICYGDAYDQVSPDDVVAPSVTGCNATDEE